MHVDALLEQRGDFVSCETGYSAADTCNKEIFIGVYAAWSKRKRVSSGPRLWSNE